MDRAQARPGAQRRVGADAVLRVHHVVRRPLGARRPRPAPSIERSDPRARPARRRTPRTARRAPRRPASTGRKKSVSPPRPSVQTSTVDPAAARAPRPARACARPRRAGGRVGQQRDPHRPLAVGGGVELGEVVQHPARAGDLGVDVDLGDGEAALGRGAGEDVAAGPDHLGLAEEAQPAHHAGLVGGDPDDLVLRGPGASRRGRRAATAGPAGAARRGRSSRPATPRGRPGPRRRRGPAARAASGKVLS